MRECCNCHNPIKKGYKCAGCKLSGRPRVRHCRDCKKVVKKYQRCPEHRAQRALALKLRRRERAQKTRTAAAAA